MKDYEQSDLYWKNLLFSRPPKVKSNRAAIIIGTLFGITLLLLNMIAIIRVFEDPTYADKCIAIGHSIDIMGDCQ